MRKRHSHIFLLNQYFFLLSAAHSHTIICKPSLYEEVNAPKRIVIPILTHHTSPFTKASKWWMVMRSLTTHRAQVPADHATCCTEMYFRAVGASCLATTSATALRRHCQISFSFKLNQHDKVGENSADHRGEKLDRERKKRTSPGDERTLAVQCDGVECQSETRRRTQLWCLVYDITNLQPLGIRDVFNLTRYRAETWAHESDLIGRGAYLFFKPVSRLAKQRNSQKRIHHVAQHSQFESRWIWKLRECLLELSLLLPCSET